MFETIIYEKKEASAWITLNRPNSFNGMNHKLLQDFNDALEMAANDKEVRVVMITGAGKAFSAGGDVQWMRTAQGENFEQGFHSLVELLHQAILKIRGMEKPVIAKVNGVASGAGFSLALACDLRIVSEQVKFNQAYVNIALTPDGGSTYFLTKMVGPAMATELIFTGRVVDAKEAFSLGLINKLVPAELLDQEAEKMAAFYSSGPTIAYAKAKKLINRAMGGELEKQLQLELESIVSSGLTEDFKEGLEAFFGKRKPEYKGK
jgi:2-(1,2-epoxy-1,2-dihydrophenyl)acetyl-CoA isomerase